jgi:hypothetical protein
MSKEQFYCSFLLRIWRSGPATAPRWRASLEDIRTGEQRGFASLAQAFAFLEEQTEHPTDAAQAAPGPQSAGEESG